ncbi:MAG: hypothetical protein GY713_18185 [Actinomycetia bacterium]|nr:hypothetical protein [Actinomycetes bacterium]
MSGGAILLVTGSVLPEPDEESAAVVDALLALGVDAALVSWTDPDIDWAAAERVVIRSTWDYPDHHDRFLDWCQRVGGATDLWNPAAVVEWNVHKGYLLDLAAAGLPVIPSGVCGEHSGVIVAEAAAEVGWEDIVLKPAVGVGGFGVEVFASSASGAQTHLEMLNDLGDALMQPFMPGLETSLIWMGGEFSHAVAKPTPPGEFRAQVHLGARVEATEASTEQIELGRSALETVGSELLYACVDLVDSGGVPTIMELELIEPSLFLAATGTVGRFAEVLAE